ncbi:MAG: aminoacyl-tRNA hydrolase [Chloroflexi bacterium]|nr:aminoacyl-tRNA hydrolase [Chloroflexota bacterium]
MKLIVGLGNPGRDFARHRHNVGFRCVNAFARRHGLAFSRSQCQARIARGVVGGEEVVLARPQTFMNRSGVAVAGLVKALRITARDLLVIYDDLDLLLGAVRLRPGGSAGGHHGMESIIAALGSRDFPRLRVGIGRPSGGDVVSYVLEDFSPEEDKEVEKAVATAVEALECYLAEGLEEAMTRFNRRKGDEVEKP